MNMDPDQHYGLHSDLIEKVTTTLASINWLSWKAIDEGKYTELGFDYAIEISTKDGRIAELWIEIKDQPRPASFPFTELKRQLGREPNQRDRIPVLAAPTISPRVAELCRSNGWSWIDLAGNCFLNIPGGVWIERTGLRSTLVKSRPDANLGTAEAARVLRVILHPQNLRRVWTQRVLKDSCYPKVSLGLVNKVVRHLKDQKYLVNAPGGKGFNLCDPDGLLMEWCDAYRFDRHYHINLQSSLDLEAIKALVVARQSEDPLFSVLAIHSAAQTLNPELPQSEKTWVYIGRDSEAQFRTDAQAKPVSASESNLVILIPEDESIFYDARYQGSSNLPITGPLQTYLDLTKCEGKESPAAESILEQFLKPKWKDAELLRG